MRKLYQSIQGIFQDIYKYPHLFSLVRYSLLVMLTMSLVTSVSVLIYSILSGLDQMNSIAQVAIIITAATLLIFYRLGYHPLKLATIYLVLYFVFIMTAAFFLTFFHSMIIALVIFLIVMAILLLDKVLRQIVLAFYSLSIFAMLIFELIEILRDPLLLLDNYIGEFIGVITAIVMIGFCVWGFKNKFIKLSSDLFMSTLKDPLTDTFNIRKLNQELENKISQYNHDQTNFSVVVMDLDNFKEVNDTLGHNTGDQLLKSFAAVVKRHLRENDLIVRYGGDEFVLLLPGCDKESCFAICQRMFEGVQNLVSQYTTISLSFSGGISDYAETHGAEIDIIKLADQRMYISKNMGKSRVTLYDE